MGVLLALGAAARAAEVEVAAVRFQNLRAPTGAAGNWHEAEIALNARPAPGAASSWSWSSRSW